MKQLIVTVLVCLLPVCSFAAKALTEWQAYTQPDGSVLILTLCGDENGYCYVDLSGTAYLPDSLGVLHLITEEQRSAKTRTVRRAGGQLLPKTDWDPDRIYRQPVVLLSFSDMDFRTDNPQATYDSIFNKRGYNQGDGPGCVADYFREQSGGRLNLQFDVYGPVTVDVQARLNLQDDEINHGEKAFAEAMDRLSSLRPDIDFSLYDWDGDGLIEQVVFVYAGYTGNQSASLGHIWPNTGYLDFTTPGNLPVRYYSASGELWSNDRSCGIGTVCHEYSHCLGLPDIYPTSKKDVSYSSVVDQWDLMDGGNATNWGWSPPNYSPFEKMLMGWLVPTELDADTVITEMMPIAEGGTAYLIKHTEDEFLLLENRRWQSWDIGAPGQGLLIWHINYDQRAWQDNTVNNTEGTPDYHLITADGMDYTNWVDLYRARGGTNTYQDKTRRLHRCILSTAPYPWATDSTDFVNSELTDFSMPASRMYHQNSTGSCLLSKPVTDITRHDNGTISFVFHASTPDALAAPLPTTRHPSPIYTLTGRKVHSTTEHFPDNIYIIDKKKVRVSKHQLR